jgi:hypothetical protein
MKNKILQINFIRDSNIIMIFDSSSLKFMGYTKMQQMTGLPGTCQISEMQI